MCLNIYIYIAHIRSINDEGEILSRLAPWICFGPAGQRSSWERQVELRAYTIYQNIFSNIAEHVLGAFLTNMPRYVTIIMRVVPSGACAQLQLGKQETQAARWEANGAKQKYIC